MDIDNVLEKRKQLIDEQGGYIAVRERLLLARVYFALGLRKDDGKGESIILSYKDSIENRMVLFDIYLPKGISILKIPANSVIEIKGNLIADALHRSNDIAKLWKHKYPNSKVYLLYGENSIVSETVLRKAKSLRLSDIYRVDKFISDVEKKKKLNDTIRQEEKTWKEKRKAILDSAQFSFREDNCTLFLGAGVSQDAGGPSWNTLLMKSVKRLRKPLTKVDFNRIYRACSMSPIIMGRYIVGNKKQKEILTKYLHDYVLYKDVDIKESKLISAICRMVSTRKIESIITYNYDDLIETALSQYNIEVASLFSKSRSLKEEIPVYHVHGLIPEKTPDVQSTPVLSEEEYHAIYSDSYHWSNVEQLHALDRNTCFFIGLSMTDPNLRRLLDISHKDGDKEIRHFAFLKREKLYASDKKHEKNEVHFRIIENQLEDLGVNVIWYEDHKEIPPMLEEICAELKLVE